MSLDEQNNFYTLADKCKDLFTLYGISSNITRYIKNILDTSYCITDHANLLFCIIKLRKEIPHTNDCFLKIYYYIMKKNIWQSQDLIKILKFFNKINDLSNSINWLNYKEKLSDTIDMIKKIQIYL